jgi:peroxiredoxin
MIRSTQFIIAAAVLAVASAAVAANFDVGPAVGARIPALHVTDAAGKPQTVKALAGKKGVVLMFFRSAKWCPYCQAQLIAMKAAPEALAARGYTLAAISYDDPQILTEFAAKREINYPLLSDKGSITIDAWAMRDPQYKPDSIAFGVPMPGIFIIARDGVVRAKLAEQGYKTRPPLDAVLASIDALPAK